MIAFMYNKKVEDDISFEGFQSHTSHVFVYISAFSPTQFIKSLNQSEIR